MTSRKRELLILLAIIGGAVLFRVLLFIPLQSKAQPSVNTAGLPVQSGKVTVKIADRIFHPTVLVVSPE